MSDIPGNIIRSWDRAVEVFGPMPQVAIDLETSGLSPWSDKTAVVILAGPQGELAVLHGRGYVNPALVAALRGKLLIGHNLVGFDSHFLAKHGLMPDDVEWYDTMTAEQALLPMGRRDYRTSLSATLERRFASKKARKDKLEGEHSWMVPELSEEQVHYAANDVLHLFELRRRQYQRADETPGLRQAIDMEMAIMPAVIYMKLNGLPISVATMEALVVQKAAEADATAAEIFDLIGRPINLNSPVQLKKACHDLGLMVPNTTWDTFRIIELTAGDDQPLASLIIRWKQAAQIVKMYQPKWQEEHIAADGRVHGSFWPLGTDTGRFTASDPNLQQVPRAARQVYEAPDGYAIVSADYSQIEVRIAAAQAHDQVMLRGLLTGDIHSAVAAEVFGVPLGEVTKTQRSLAKACVFTLLFAGSAKRLHETVRLSGGSTTMEEAEQLVIRFFRTYPGLWWARQRAVDLSKRRSLAITLPTGIRRVLTYNSDWSKRTNTPQTILNTMVQGTAAAGLKHALRLCVERGLHRSLVATVHDELVGVVREGEAEAYGKALAAAMVDGMAEVTDAPVVVEWAAGKSWSHDGRWHGTYGNTSQFMRGDDNGTDIIT